MTHLRKAAALTSLVLVASLLVVGCERPSTPEAERAELIERAQSFWEAKSAREYEQSYRYLEPEWKARMTQGEWEDSFGLVDWSNPQVLDAKVEGSQGIIKVRFDWELKGTIADGRTGDTEANERWVKVGDLWYKEEPGHMDSPDWDTFPLRES